MISELVTLEERQRVVEEAKTWLLTPFHHMARVKGVGVDCSNMICSVYETCGVWKHREIEYYPLDWHLHRDDERYLKGVMEVADEIESEAAQIGDLVLFRFGRSYAHSGIIVGDNLVIQADLPCGVIYTELTSQPLLPRKKKFFNPWAYTK